MRPTMQLLARQCCSADVPARIAIEAAACTRVGSRRLNNEDGHYVDGQGHVFVVADGIGGASAGERASQMAVELLPHNISDIVSGIESSEDEVSAAMRAAFAETNAAILRAARENAEFHKMGTTAVMALVIDHRLFIASIGDSRAYLVRAGHIEQLTVDHTMAQALVDSGTISREAALRHQWRNVLWKHLGSADDHAPDGRVLDLQDGDRIVLATDGLTNVVDEQTILQITEENLNTQDAATTLIQAVEQKKGGDDATCVVLFVKELDEPVTLDWWHDCGNTIGLAIRN